MKNTPNSKNTSIPDETMPLSILVARMTWVLIGPIVLILTGIGIITSASGWLTKIDAFYGFMVILILFARWVEFGTGRAMTLTGELVTNDQFRRYMIVLPLTAAIGWIIANSLGNHILK
jgi:hypothetical protein